jgi:hypothetical protein
LAVLISLIQAISNSQIMGRMMGSRNRPVIPYEIVPPIRMTGMGVSALVP